jgi:protein ImuB
MLWLCLSFPQLPLEIFSRAEIADSPWAIIQGKGTHQTLFLCNAIAESCGIHSGMSPGAAYALNTSLRLCARDEAAEQQALESLAAWAGQFTSQVSIFPPNALLLEIEGSLNLFHGMEALLRRIRRRAARLGYVTEFGISPTPLAAWLLARAHITAPVTQIQNLPAALRDLPLPLLGFEEKLLHTLHGLGLRYLGDVLRLPRSGLARRFGPTFLDYLDRLLGVRTDPRNPYVHPPRFERQVMLPAETCDREALLFPARRLLLELAGFLAGRQAGTQQLHWTLTHHRQPATHLMLGLAAPNRDPHHFLSLLRERLARTLLDHPVDAVALEVTDIRRLQPRALTLDGAQDIHAEDWPLLVEKLRARLGDEAVRGVRCHPDHRPEQAWRPSRVETPNPNLSHALRPLWLLPEPVVLDTRDGIPSLDGHLYIETGPERIESGWWDGRDMARDYYIASDTAHSRYWIYRERRGARRWFLHGLFA